MVQPIIKGVGEVVKSGLRYIDDLGVLNKLKKDYYENVPIGSKFSTSNKMLDTEVFVLLRNPR